jgi:hypothetical protein
MKRTDEAGPRGAAAFLSRPILLALAVIAVIAVYIAFLGGESPTELPPERLDERPTGAGSLPDGPVDENIEGLGNETSTGDFIDSSGASDLRPEILDAGEGPPPATSVEELDVPDRINEGVVEPGPPPD